MLKNYLTIAVRNFLRQKLYAFINIFGLALGIACCLLMGLFVEHEWSHDRFHQHKDRLFRVLTQETNASGGKQNQTLFPYTMVDELKSDLTGITRASAFMKSKTNVGHDDHVFRETIGLVSPDFLTMFTFPLLSGDPATALSRPENIVISKTTAQKYFGTRLSDYGSLLGKSLTVASRTYEITGIAADVPDVSSLQFDALIPAEHYRNFALNYDADDEYASIYVQLADGQTPQDLGAQLKSFADMHLGKRIENLKKNKAIADKNAFTLTLQPLKDMYWNDHIRTPYEASGNLKDVYILWGLAGLVLLIACSNFTTMSIANSSNRALEIGLRKVLGADRRQVMQQFWSEALFLSFIGLLLGLALTELFLPVFSGLIQRDLTVDHSANGFFFVFLSIIVVIVGLLAGSYPAAVLSRFQPISALKGEKRIGGRSRFARILVALQYTASVALMVCTGVMVQQQWYMSAKDLGYDHEHVIVVSGGVGEERAVVDRYKQEILKDPRVMHVSIADRAFTTGDNGTGCDLGNGTRVVVRLLGIDADYLSTLQLPLLQGRNFSDAYATDRDHAVLINEKLAKRLKMENPVGQVLTGFDWNGLTKPTIIGVVKDFHIDSLHHKIQPLVLQMKRFSYGPFVLIRVRPGNMHETVGMLEAVWKRVAPNAPIRLSFLDENLDQQYRNDRRWQRIVNYSAIFTLLISCLGLFGLTSLTVTRRTKEIGIRKVLGASVTTLVSLLSMDFIKIFILANFIAWPLAYWAMVRWFQNFAYHVHLGIGVFVFSGALALFVALFTVSLQTLKAARSNPVDALRNE